jgi:hypothetical protein
MTENPDVQITPYGMSLIVRGHASDGMLEGCIAFEVVKVVGTEVQLELSIADPKNGEIIAYYGQYPMSVGGEPVVLHDWGAAININVEGDEPQPPEYPQLGDRTDGRTDIEGSLGGEDQT